MPNLSRSPAYPLPFLEVPAPSKSSSRRLRARRNQNYHAVSLANHAIGTLNQLYSQSPPQQPQQAIVQSQLQTRLVSNILSASQRYVSRLPTPKPGKSGDPLQAYEPDFSDLLKHLASPPLFDYSIRQQAVPIIADKMSLPERAGTVSLLDALPPDTASLYANIENIIRQPEQQDFGKARVFGSHEEYVKALRRMRAADMLTFTTQPVFVSSVFAVPKPDGTQRLILDARPVCEHSVEPENPELTDPSILCGMMLPGKTMLYTGKTDLSNAFYTLRTPDSWHPYFAMPPVRASELGLDGFPPESLVYPCLAVLAMGWNHSCFLMQRAHTRLLSLDFDTNTLITRDSDRQLDRLRIAIYLDDVSWFGPCAAVVDNAIARYVTRCGTEGWIIKPAKCQAASLRGIESLGCEVDGVRGCIGRSPAKLHALIDRTNRLLDKQHCSGRDMAALVGSWTWACLVRRPLLSVFSSVYRFIETAQTRVFRIWPSVQRELNIMTGVAPLLFADLRANWMPALVATDASEHALGVVYMKASTDEVASLASRAQDAPDHQSRAHASAGPGKSCTSARAPNPVTSGPVRCDQIAPQSSMSQALRTERKSSVPDLPPDYRPSPAITSQDASADHTGPSLSARVKAVPVAALPRRHWATIIAHQDGWLHEHITARELRAIGAAVRWIVSYPRSINARLFLIGDSLAALGALAKGRSSAFALRSTLRRIAALTVAAGLQLVPFYIASAHNPADAPSRAPRTFVRLNPGPQSLEFL
jgi:hypothetical protein